MAEIALTGKAFCPNHGIVGTLIGHVSQATDCHAVWTTLTTEEGETQIEDELRCPKCGAILLEEFVEFVNPQLVG